MAAIMTPSVRKLDALVSSPVQAVVTAEAAPVDNINDYVIMTKAAGERATKYSFRRKPLNGNSNKKSIVQAAGNLLKWSSYTDMLKSGFVRNTILKTLEEYVKEHPDEPQINLTITTDDYIGWATSMHEDELSKKARESLELVPLKKNCTAMFVNDFDTLAPLTKSLSVSVYKKPKTDDGDEYLFIINNMYPGPNLGEHRGDITMREHRVLFDWEHPGQPLSALVKPAAAA